MKVESGKSWYNIEENLFAGRLYGQICRDKIFMRDTEKMCYVDVPLAWLVNGIKDYRISGI